MIIDRIFSSFEEMLDGLSRASMQQKIIAIIIFIAILLGISMYVGLYLLLTGGILQIFLGFSDPQSSSAIFFGIARIFGSFLLIPAGFWAAIISCLTYFKKIGRKQSPSDL